MWNSLKAWLLPTPAITLEVRNWELMDEYRTFRESNPDIYLDRNQQQLDLIQGKAFKVKGFCYICQAERNFTVTLDYADGRSQDGKLLPNWREQLNCESCGNYNRIRAMLQFIEETVGLKPDARVFLAEQISPLYQLMKARFPHLVGSEYLGSRIAYGATDPSTGVRNESIVKLSFADSSLDAIITCDVFEHVPEVQIAFTECYRCLKPEGVLVFSIPFNLGARHCELRARINAQGELEHLQEAQYHGDPLSSEGCLVFHDFGWDLLDKLKVAGFKTATLHTYWSSTLANLGTEGIVFTACK